MRRTTLAALSAAALAACSRTSAPAPAAGPSPAPAMGQPAPFLIQDLAAATALDARLARLAAVAMDVEAALGAAGEEARRARDAAAPRLTAALDGVTRAADAVHHPLDQPGAERVSAAARAYVASLRDAAAQPGPPPRDLVAARDTLGEAVGAYRRARGAYGLAAPQPAGAELAFAEARRDMERAEMSAAAVARVAPREAGHELDPATARMTARMAAQRAQEAAPRLPGPLRDPAARYAAAEGRTLELVDALRAARAAEKPAVARAYQAAKADALEALADYFTALAGPR